MFYDVSPIGSDLHQLRDQNGFFNCTFSSHCMEEHCSQTFQIRTGDDVILTVLYLLLWVCDFTGQPEFCNSIRGRVEWSKWPVVWVQLLNADSDMLEAFLWLRLKAVAFHLSMDTHTQRARIWARFLPTRVYPFAKLLQYYDKVAFLIS